MYLRNLKTNDPIRAAIESVSPKELKSIVKNKAEFCEFDWGLEKDKEVYKLFRTDTGEVLGLMSILDNSQSHYVEIKLLEVGQSNVGSGKEIEGIAGCLIAWACRLSFVLGHHGWIMLTAKTNLIEHYKKKYGMLQVGNSKHAI